MHKSSLSRIITKIPLCSQLLPCHPQPHSLIPISSTSYLFTTYFDYHCHRKLPTTTLFVTITILIFDTICVGMLCGYIWLTHWQSKGINESKIYC